MKRFIFFTITSRKVIGKSDNYRDRNEEEKITNTKLKEKNLRA